MIKTIKTRIYPNRKTKKALIKMMKGVDIAWNELNRIQSERMRELNPVVIEKKTIIDKKSKKPKEVEIVHFNSLIKADIQVPYSNKKEIQIKTREKEGALIRRQISAHFLAQYTEIGKKLSSEYGVPSATSEQVCKKFEGSIKKIIGDADSFYNYVGSGFSIKPRMKANFLPFRDGGISLSGEFHFKFAGNTIRLCKENRSLYNLVNNLDSKLLNNSSDLSKSLKNGAINRDNYGKWFLSVSMDLEDISQIEKQEGHIGIDPGFNTCITTSEGKKYNREDVTLLQKKKKDLQRKACKSKGGKIRVLTRKVNGKQENIFYKPSLHILKRVGAISKKITRKKRHWEWEVAKEIVSNGKTICMGDFGVKGMARIYGKSVNREAIFSLWEAIEWKAKAQGISTFRVSERKTTYTCSSCHEETGPRGKEGLGIREWTCSSCGEAHDRDVNAAINIREKINTLEVKGRKKRIKSERNLHVSSIAKNMFTSNNNHICIYDIKAEVKEEGNGNFLVSLHKKSEIKNKVGERIGQYRVNIGSSDCISVA